MDKLNFIRQEMDILGIPYEFMEWTSKVQYPYFVGEYTDVATLTEDGYEESTFIITGFTRGKWIDLERIKEKIKNHFPVAGGLRSQTDSGSITVFFSGAFPVPTGEMDLKKIQINLDIKEWKGMN